MKSLDKSQIIKNIEKDFKKVVKSFYEPLFNTDINPIRCHEMAYLINKGMNLRGYNSVIENGIFDKRLNHSWTRVFFGKFLWNSLFLDFQFSPHNQILGPIPVKRVYNFREARIIYKKRKIDYELANGIKDFSENIFNSAPQQHPD